MDTSEKIRSALDRVERLRMQQRADPHQCQAVTAVKQLQAQRFTGSYADLLALPSAQQSAALFFLDELYSARDYSARDAQFARIAGTIDRLFPRRVADVARLLAELHALTEGLDDQMAGVWRTQSMQTDAGTRYVQAWRQTGCEAQRRQQLAWVLQLGRELQRLTATPGLRLLLKMMRKPAQAAGLLALQHFLEAGFDTFAGLADEPGGATAFLAIIEVREAALMDRLFTDEPVACATELGRILGLAR